MRTAHGYWTADYPRADPVIVTLDFGSPVAANELVLVATHPLAKDEVDRLRPAVEGRLKGREVTY